MELYGAIDLHSNNGCLAICDKSDRLILQTRVPNELELVLQALAAYKDQLVGVVVESTFNWYWLVDGLMDHGYRVHLANPGAMVPYRGLKYSDDRSDARWLTHLLRLGILPEGYIYPKQQRGLRDLLRKRGALVRQRTANVLSLKNIYQRSTGRHLTSKDLRELGQEQVSQHLCDPNVAQSACSTLRIVQSLAQEIASLERAVSGQLKPDPALAILRTAPGIGPTLSSTILLETGSIRRFPAVGNYASYCRTVDSKRLSNLKVKGHGNKKNGNPHLSWAYVEAANFAVRYSQPVRRFYDRKKARTCRVVALKAVASKLARACYYMLRDQVPFKIDKAFR